MFMLDMPLNKQLLINTFFKDSNFQPFLGTNPSKGTLNGSFLTHQPPKIPGASNIDPLLTIYIFSLKY